ncbi:MAG: hypothetical protein U9Q30_05600, partial [Campylobacterota bacterium]|nr:hypothetical protein [Campylobacterota bacterium]
DKKIDTLKVELKEDIKVFRMESKEDNLKSDKRISNIESKFDKLQWTIVAAIIAIFSKDYILNLFNN